MGRRLPVALPLLPTPSPRVLTRPVHVGHRETRSPGQLSPLTVTSPLQHFSPGLAAVLSHLCSKVPKSKVLACGSHKMLASQDKLSTPMAPPTSQCSNLKLPPFPWSLCPSILQHCQKHKCRPCERKKTHNPKCALGARR